MNVLRRLAPAVAGLAFCAAACAPQPTSDPSSTYQKVDFGGLTAAVGVNCVEISVYVPNAAGVQVLVQFSLADTGQATDGGYHWTVSATSVEPDPGGRLACRYNIVQVRAKAATGLGTSDIESFRMDFDGYTPDLGLLDLPGPWDYQASGSKPAVIVDSVVFDNADPSCRVV